MKAKVKKLIASMLIMVLMLMNVPTIVLGVATMPTSGEKFEYNLAVNPNNPSQAILTIRVANARVFSIEHNISWDDKVLKMATPAGVTAANGTIANMGVVLSSKVIGDYYGMDMGIAASGTNGSLGTGNNTGGAAMGYFTRYASTADVGSGTHFLSIAQDAGSWKGQGPDISFCDNDDNVDTRIAPVEFVYIYFNIVGNVEDINSNTIQINSFSANYFIGPTQYEYNQASYVTKTGLIAPGSAEVVSANIKIDGTVPTTGYKHGDDLTTAISSGTLEIQYSDGSSEEKTIAELGADVAFKDGKNTADVNDKFIKLTYGGIDVASYAINVADAVTDIIVLNASDNTEYNEGVSINKSKLTITAIMASGATLPVNPEDVTLSEGVANVNSPTFTWENSPTIPKIGTQEITVGYEGEEDKFTILVNDTVKDISVTTQPTNKANKYGEEFNRAGGVVTVETAGGSTFTIPLTDGSINTNYNKTPIFAKANNVDSRVSAEMVHPQTVTVYYAGKEATITGVTTEDYVDTITVNGQKQNYTYGDPLSNVGEIKPILKSGRTAIDIPLSSANISGYVPNTLLNQTLTVTYNGAATQPYATTTYEVGMQDEVTNITITPPDKLTYNVGESLNLTGAWVNAEKKSGASSSIPVTLDMITPAYSPNPTFTGNAISVQQNLIIEYPGATSLPITVTTNDVVSGIALSPEPNKETYEYGESLDTSGGNIVATYSGGSTRNVMLLNTMVSGFNSTPTITGSDTYVDQLLTVDYGGKQTDYTVRINRRSTNADLSDLTVGGTKVNGFDKDTISYTITLPTGTTVAPTVAATKADPKAGTPVITQANFAASQMTATVLVTAEEGNTKTYTITFNVDNTRPTINISNPSPEFVKPGEDITYTVTYGGAVDLDEPDSEVNIINALSVTGTAGGTRKSIDITGDDTTGYTATIVITAGATEGTVGISLAPGSAKNASGSTDLGATSLMATVDNTPPVINSPANNDIINQNVLPNITESNIDAYTLTKGGNPVVGYAGETITDDGIYVLTVTDKVGNQATVTFTIDKTNPTISVPANNTKTNQNVTPSYSDTNLSHATLSKNGGTAESYVQGTKIENEGSYVLTVYDTAGNSSTVNFTIDTTSPTVKFEPNGGAGSNDPSTTVTVTEPTSGGTSSGIATNPLQYVWSTDGSTVPLTGWTNFTSGAPITKTGSTDDTYYLWINAVTDNAGNAIPATVSNAFIKDSTAPGLTLSADKTFVKVGETVTYTATYENVDISSIDTEDYLSITGPGTITDVIINGNIATITVMPTGGDGAITLSIAADSAVHQSIVSMKAPAVSDNTVIVDNTLPVINSPANSTITKNSVTPNITEDNIDAYTLTKDGNSITYTGGAITDEGSYTLKVTDKVGNESSTVNFIIDKTLPTITYPTTSLETENNVEPVYTDANGIASVILTKDGNPVVGYAGERIEDIGDYVLTVTDNAGNSSNVAFKIYKKSTDADLNDLTVGGKTVTGFDKDDTEYTVILPAGTTVIPTVAATKAHSKAGTPVITQANIVDDPMEATVVVTAEDGITIKTYKITFVIDDESNRPTINIDTPNPEYVKSGEDVTFTVRYTGAVDLDEPDSEVNIINTLSVTGTTGGTRKSIAITGDDATGYTVTIVITAGATEGTVGIQLAEGSAHNGSGSAAPAKASLFATIDNTLPVINSPANSTITKNSVTPNITEDNIDAYTLTKDGSPITYTGGAITDEGSYTLKVTDKAGNESSTVNFIIDKTPPTITYPTPSLEAENNVEPVYTDANGITSVTLTKDGNQVVGYAGGRIEDSGEYVLTVTDNAGNSSNVAFKIYKKSTDADLSDLTVGGKTVTGFDKDDTEYTVILPAGTTVIPTVGATKSDSKAGTPVITQANITDNPMEATVVVTAEDGTTTKTYKIIFVIDDENNRPIVSIDAPDLEYVKSGEDVTFTVRYTGAVDLDEADIIATLGITGTAGGTKKSIAIVGDNTTGYIATIVITTGATEGTVGIELAEGSAYNGSGSAASAKASVFATVDNTLPVINSPANSTITKNSVTPSVTENNIDTYTLTKDGNPVVYAGGAIADEGTYTLKVIDKAGNESSIVSFIIDKTPPTVTHPTEGLKTKDSVTPTYNDANGVYSEELTKNGNPVAGYAGGLITDEGTYILTVTDNAGNSRVITFEIDNTLPTATVNYNPNTSTNGNVIATIETSESIQTPTGWTKVDDTHYTKEYTENTTENVTIVDLAGNTNAVNVSVTNIDKVGPTGTVSYSPSGTTNGTVTATIESSKPIQTPTGWTKVDDRHYTKEYTSNTTETVTIKDLAGNTDTVTVSITNIDKTNPTGTVNYDTTSPTNGNVIATIETSEPIQTPTGWTKVNDTHYTKEYTANTTETVTITDLAGNTGSVNVSVANIDKTSPTGTASYSTTSLTEDNVTVTIETSKEIQTPAGWTKVDATHYTKEYTTNTTETVTITDLAGNTGSVNVSISNIRQVASVTILAEPNTLEYNYGDAIDLTGLVLNVTFTDSGTTTVSYPNSRIALPNGNMLDSEIGDSVAVIVDYGGQQATFNVKVNDVLQGIEMTGPTKTDYEVGDTVDTAGITITEVWAYAGRVDIPLGTAGITIDGYNTPLEVADNKVTVNYKTKTQNFPIAVSDPIVDIEAIANKTEYKYGESLDVTVNAIRKSGTKTDVTGQETNNYNSAKLGSQNVTVSYNGFSKSIAVTVNDYVTGIEWITKPTKNKYNIGDSLDLTGGKIKEIMKSGASGTQINIDSSMIENIASVTSIAGGKNVKVTYTDTDGVKRVTYFPILVIDPANKIEIANMPKVDYNYGQALDLSKGSIKVTTLNGEETTISLTDSRIKVAGYNSRPTGYTSAIAEISQTLKITYTETFTTTIDGEKIEETITRTITYDVVVHDTYAGIQLVTPKKTTYTKGESLDLTGGKIKEVMASGVIRKEVEISSEHVSGYNKNTLGTQTITVTYGTITKTFKVKVENPVTGISMTNKPDKTKYEKGETLDLTGGKIKVTYENGEKEVIDLSKAKVTGYKKSTLGTQIITVTYKGQTTEFTIKVEKEQSSKPETPTTPTKPITPTTPIKPSNPDTSVTPTNPSDNMSQGDIPNNIDDTTDLVDNTDNNPNQEDNLNNNTDNKPEQNKPDIAGINESDENASGLTKIIKDILQAIKENKVPIIAFSGLAIGVIWLIVLLGKRRKNVEVYADRDGRQILVDSLRITENNPRVVLDRYKKEHPNEGFEVILKKSISKKLDRKKVTIVMNGKGINYKVNYQRKPYEIDIPVK